MALNSNQVKSKQPGIHGDGGGLYLVVRDSGERVWAFRFTGLDGKRAQMEFAKVGDRDSPSGDVLTLTSAREKAREYKVGLRRNGTDPRVKKRLSQATRKPSRSLPRNSIRSGARGSTRTRKGVGTFHRERAEPAQPQAQRDRHRARAGPRSR